MVKEWYVDEEGNRILQRDARLTIVCHLSASTRNPEVMADARLIAAAPQLLEELIAARRELRVYHHELDGEDYNNPSMNAVIAKATGETE